MRLLPSLAVALLVLAGCTTPADDPQAPPPQPPAGHQDYPALAPGLPPSAAAMRDPAAVPDPLAKGPLEVQRRLYDFGYTLVEDPGFPAASPAHYTYPTTVSGSVHSPTEGEGPFPLVVLMHGRHGTCAIAGSEILGTQACPSLVVVEPVPSFAGYDGLAETLASHGYVVASIDANHVNDRDLLGDAGANARAQLVLETLDRFAEVNATGSAASLGGSATFADLQGRIDMGRVGLMGHSRGGEGVARAVTMNLERATPHSLRAVFALAPTDFARWAIPGVPFATLLPYCDGDVMSLHGARMYDDNRLAQDGVPRHQVLAMGANHNYYNTVWTATDWGDRGDPWCDESPKTSGRDSPEDQRRHGDGLMASFFRLYVGGEAAFAPPWHGEAPWPASLCPGGQGPCQDRLMLSRHPGHEAVLAVAPDGRGAADGDLELAACEPPACPADPTYGTAKQSAYTWTSDAAVHWTLDAPQAAAGFSLRAALPPDGAAVAATLVVAAADGLHRFPLAGPALQPPPGESAAKAVLSMVQVPFGTTLHVTGLRVELAGPGEMQVADVLLLR